MCTRTAVDGRTRRHTARYLGVAVASGVFLLSTRDASAQDTTRAGRDTFPTRPPREMSPDERDRMKRALMDDDARRDTVIGRLGREMRRLGSMHWTIPEYHDEQRFLDGASGFGPVANIYASPMLDGFTEEWQIEAQGNPGVLVAIVVVDPPDGGGTLPSTYTNLSLSEGINCLWLQYDRTAGPPPKRWKGHIASATAAGECDRTATSTMHDLEVQRSTHPSHTRHGDYPPVGRFSETSAGQPLLGTKCLNGWCEFGPAGFASLPPSGGNTGREDRVRGWHDEQILEEPTVAGPKRGPRGVIIPAPNVNTHPESDFEGRWVPVARIKIVDPLLTTSKYHNGGLRQGMNFLELRKDGNDWKARVRPNGASSWQLLPYVEPELHYDAVVPGTARWRYTRADDGVWVPCGQRCCRAQF